MELIFSMLLFSLLATPLSCDKGAFAYLITSSSSCKVDPVYGVGLERTVPAVDLALDYINFHTDLLPTINLTYGTTVNSLEVLIFSPLFMLANNKSVFKQCTHSLQSE